MPDSRESTDELVALAQKTWRRQSLKATTVAVTVYNDLLADAKRLAGSVISQANAEDQSDGI